MPSIWLRSLIAAPNRAARKARRARPADRPACPIPTARLGVAELEDRVVPATYTVTTAADGGPGSLRQAVADANANWGADTITFSPALNGQTINFYGGRMAVNTDLTIQGPGAKSLTLAGGGGQNLFDVFSPGSLTVSGLTVRGGFNPDGGAFFNLGTLTVADSYLTGNRATAQGGAVYSAGTLTVRNSTIAGNSTSGSGGAISVARGSTTVVNSTLDGNTAAGGGGAMIAGVGSTVRIDSSTITRNSGGGDGGIGSGSNLTINNSILSGNTVYGSPFDLGINGAGGPLTAFNDLVGDGGRYSGVVNAVNGNLTGVDPLLGPLQDNGGPTPTRMPLAGSPAANAGNAGRLPAGVFADQRGQARISTGTPLDIGAVESALPVAAAPPPQTYTVAGESIATRALTAAVNGASTVFRGTVDIPLVIGGVSTNVSVNVGGGNTAGLVVQNGQVVQFGGTVNGSFTARGLQFSADNLTVNYDRAANQITITGGASASFTAQSGTSVSLAVTLGGTEADGTKTDGIVIKDGRLAELDATVNSSFTVKSVKFNATDLNITYSAASNQYTVSGGATLEFTARGQQINLGVELGEDDFKGLVIQDGQLQELAVKVDANFSLLGLDFEVNGLGVRYSRADGTFAVAGGVKVTSAAQGGSRVFDHLAVQFGDNFSAPGILITNGSLTSLDIKVDAAFKLFGVNVKADGLRVQYNQGTGNLQFTGAIDVTLVSGASGRVALPNGGITVNTQTGAVNVNGVSLQVSNIKLGPVEIRDLAVSYQQTAGSFSVSARGEISLLNGKIVAAGSFSIVDGRLRSVSVSASFANPGIPIVQGVVYLTSVSGSVDNLDNVSQLQVHLGVQMSVGPKISFAGQSFSLAEINGSISITTQQATIAGNVTILGGLLGKGSGSVTFGFTNPQFVQVQANVSAYFGILNGNLSFRVDTLGNVDAQVGLSLRTPDFLPTVAGVALGGRTVAAVSGSLKIRPNSNNPYDNIISVAGSILGIGFSVGLYTKSIPGPAAGGVTLNTRGIELYIDAPWPLADIHKFWKLNGSGGAASAAADGVSLSAADVTAEDDNGAITGDLGTAPPTVQVNGVSVNPGSPDGTVVFTPAVATNPSTATVTLYADRDNAGYDGDPIAVDLPYRPGGQAYTWKDLAAFADEPYNPDEPLYVYAEIDDHVHAPVYSAYSGPVTPPDYDPALAAPPSMTAQPGQPVVFSAASGNPVRVADPLSAADPTVQVEATLSVTDGTLTLGAVPGGVTVSGNGTDRVVLDGPAAAITAALDGLRYSPIPGAYFGDTLTVTVGRFPTMTGGVETATVAIVDRPLALTVPATVSYASRSGPAALLAGVALSDPATTVLTGATVRVIGSVPGVDELAFANQSGITGVYDPAAGTLTLSGAATLDQYRQALASVTYSSTGSVGRSLEVTAVDDAGNTADVVVSVAVAPAANPPVVRQVTPGPVYAAGGAGVAFDPQLTVSDPAGGTLTGATVRFVEGYTAGEDMLGFAAQNGITGTFDPATGTLTLTGTASVAAYQAALQSVTYSNAAAGPAAGVRTVAVTVTDGASTSAAALLRAFVAVGPANLSSPVVALPPVAAALPAGAASVAVTEDIAIASENAATLVGATVTITAGFTPGEDYLSVGNLPAGITASYDATTGTLTLSGVASVASYEAALASVVYENHGTVRTGAGRTLVFAVNDGVTAPGTGTVAVAVDAPPVVAANGAVAYPTGQAAVAVSSGLLVWSRGGDGSLTGATVAITGDYNPAEDRLVFTPQNGITGSFDPATGVLTLTGTASAAAYQAALRSVQYQNLHANPTAGEREITFAVAGGSGASDPAGGRVLVDVLAGQAHPAVAINAGSVVFPEGSAPLPLLPNLTLTDPDGGDPVVFGATVEITGGYVPGEDVLAFAAAAGITGEFFADTGELILTGAAPLSAYQAVLRSITYRDLSPAPSTQPRVVSVVVDDGIPNGAAVATTAVLPTSLNDAPTRSAGTAADLTALGNAGGASLGLGGLAYAPPAGETTLVYTVTAVPDPALGRIILADGTAAVVGGTYTLDQIRGAKFVPASAAASGTDAFTFTVAGVDPVTGRTDPAALTETLHVTAVARPPALAGVPLTAVGSAAGVVGTAELLNPDGSVKLKVTPFGADYTGGVRVAAADFNGDGVADLVVATGPGGPSHVEILDGATGAVLFQLDPFEASFTGGVNVAAGDVNGDGVPDLIVTPDAGGGPRVRVFSGAGFGLLADFFGIDDPNFRGGVRTAVGDVNGDGAADLIVTAGAGGGPRVAVFDGRTLGGGAATRLVSDFFAFESGVQNGVYVTAGDLDGDGDADLVFGGGPAAGPRVLALSGKALLAGQSTPLANFLAAGADDRGGADVAVKDLDGDGSADLVVSAGGRVRGYSGLALTSGSDAPTFDQDASAIGGVFVG